MVYLRALSSWRDG